MTHVHAGTHATDPELPLPRRHLVSVVVAALILGGCSDTSEDAATGTAEDGDAGAAADGDTGDDPEADADGSPALPDVATVDPDQIDPDATEGIDGALASSADGLPDGWDTTVVADPTLGPYVVGLPAGSTVWRVGDDLAPLREAAADTAWLRYWEPVLTDASDASDSSSLRSAVVVAVAGVPEGLHLTVTATPLQDLPADDPDAIASRFAETFEQQRLTVDDVGTATAGGDEVAAVTVTTPDDEFDDGVARRLRQWFYPEVGGPVLWSVTCEGPVTAAGVVDEVCEPLLASFRTPPR